MCRCAPNHYLRGHDHVAVAQIDLIGEICDNESPDAHFQRGVTNYPAIGDDVTIIGSRELRLIFQAPGPARSMSGNCNRMPASRRYSMSTRC